MMRASVALAIAGALTRGEPIVLNPYGHVEPRTRRQKTRRIRGSASHCRPRNETPECRPAMRRRRQMGIDEFNDCDPA